MPTMLRPDGQVAATYNYVDNLPAGQAQNETNPVSLEDNLNSNRSAIARLLDATGQTKWYAALPQNGAGTPQGLAQLVSGLYAIQQMPIIGETLVLKDIALPSGQNYAILSVANGEAPALPAAIALTTFGAVVAASSNSGAQFAAHELATVAGDNALLPQNLVSIQRADNGEVLQDGQNDVFGLLVCESTTTDKRAFDDVSGGNRVKVCLVIEDLATKTLKPASAANVGGIAFNYRWPNRRPLMNMSPQAWMGRGIFKQMLGNVDVTLARAAANQGGQPIPSAASLLWQMAAGTAFKVQNANGTQDLLAITSNASGAAVQLNAQTLALATQSPVTSTAGLKVATATGTVNVGVTTNQIDAAGLVLQSTGSGALALQSAGAVTFKDTYLTGSTWTSSAVPLASSAADYNTAKSLFGEVSLMQMLIQASQHANHRNVPAKVVGGILAAGTKLTGAGSSPNLTVQLPDYSKVLNVAENVIVKLNGQELDYSPNAAGDGDWWPGEDPTKGEIYLGRPLYGTTTGHPDRIKLEVFGAT